MPSIVSAADAFLVLLALLGIVTGSLGSPKQAGIHLPQRGQDGHQVGIFPVQAVRRRELTRRPSSHGRRASIDWAKESLTKLRYPLNGVAEHPFRTMAFLVQRIQRAIRGGVELNIRNPQTGKTPRNAGLCVSSL